MKKRLAVLTVGLTVMGFAVAIEACGDDQESVFKDTDASDGAIDSTPGFGDGALPGDAGPVNCVPSSQGFTPTWTAPTAKTACQAGDLSAYYDACLKGPIDAGACQTWRQANAPCTTCLEPTDNTGPIQQYNDRYYYTLNLAGCLSLERGQPEAGACPATYAASIQCQRESCKNCLGTPGAVFSDFQSCQQKSKSDGCKTYEANIGTVCGTTYNDPDGGAWDCFPHSTDVPGGKDLFLRVMGIFCGQ